MREEVKKGTKWKSLFEIILYVLFMTGGMISFVLVASKIKIPTAVMDQNQEVVSSDMQSDRISLLDYILFGNTRE